jgi:osmotically-inducible protein OsmY
MKTDTQLKQDVVAELNWEPSVNAAQIDVEVKDGIVTLAGQVDSFTEKLSAERAVQRVSGVRALAIEMDVKLFGSSKRLDVDIASSAKNALQWTTYVPRDAVKVMVEGGQLTLSGEVDWDWQRRGALDAVRHLKGVVDVSNQIVIKFKLSTTGVKAAIEAALQRRAKSDAQQICVEVLGHDVTLTGTVNSWSDREMVTNCAWSAPGVRSVADNIRIAA